MKDSKILITGGAGFIGTHLAERLCSQNKIIIFDNLRRNSIKDIPELLKHPNVEFVKGNILDAREVLSVVKKCDVIIHLAAIAGVSSYYQDPAETLRVNLIGTINILESCKNSKIKKLIYFSTSELYGSEALNVTEESINCIGPISDFRWSYAVSKIASDHLVLRYGEKYKFKSFSIRPFNIYGPRQTGEGAISNFLRAIANNKPIIINGDGSAIRSWCYVTDCVDAVLTLFKNKTLKNEVFNIGNPNNSCTTLELAKLIRRVAKRNVPIVFKKMKRTEIRARIPNIKKAVKLLNFKPKVDLEEGIRLTYEYYKR